MAYLLLGEVHVYIEFETLKVKCTQYGICSQAAFKNARAMFFLKLGGTGCWIMLQKNPRRGQKQLREGNPRLDLRPPIVRRGGGLNVYPKGMAS